MKTLVFAISPSIARLQYFRQTICWKHERYSTHYLSLSALVLKTSLIKAKSMSFISKSDWTRSILIRNSSSIGWLAVLQGWQYWTVMSQFQALTSTWSLCSCLHIHYLSNNVNRFSARLIRFGRSTISRSRKANNKINSNKIPQLRHLQSPQEPILQQLAYRYERSTSVITALPSSRCSSDKFMRRKS